MTVARRRKPLRLRGFDYRTGRAYFVTICTYRRICSLGRVAEDGMTLSDLGQMVDAAWRDLPRYCPGLRLDCHVVMPNHIHGILMLNADATPDPSDSARMLALPDVVQRFKSFTTAMLRREWPHEHQSGRNMCLWQRSYYDRVIRDERELRAAREYVDMNPLRWQTDREFS